jgi:hypothetical protein
VEITCRAYRPRDPRKTPLYGLLESLYERVKGAWEERFERSRRGLLSRERNELLNSWRRSGFSVHYRVFVHPRLPEWDADTLVKKALRTD